MALWTKQRIRCDRKPPLYLATPSIPVDIFQYHAPHLLVLNFSYLNVAAHRPMCAECLALQIEATSPINQTEISLIRIYLAKHLQCGK